MVKILYLIVWETSDKSYNAYVFFGYICLDFHQKYVSINHSYRYALEVQYFCQWLHCVNLWNIRTY